MKTIKDKAEGWVSEHVVLAEHCGTEYSDLIEKLELLLKEQDRDTRHACAEAVIKCNEDVSGECIWKNDAHSACLSVEVV